MPLRVKQLVQERVQDLSPEHRAAVRSALTSELVSTLQTAASNGGLDVLLSLDPVAGQPVPASCLLTSLSGRGEAVAGLLETLSSGDDGVAVQELDLVDVAGAAAVRRLSTRTEQVEPVGDLAGGALTVTQLEYFVPLPGTEDLLVLAFSTPVEQLGPPLVRLFDVIATSLRWVSP